MTFKKESFLGFGRKKPADVEKPVAGPAGNYTLTEWLEKLRPELENIGEQKRGSRVDTVVPSELLLDPSMEVRPEDFHAVYMRGEEMPFEDRQGWKERLKMLIDSHLQQNIESPIPAARNHQMSDEAQNFVYKSAMMRIHDSLEPEKQKKLQTLLETDASKDEILAFITEHVPGAVSLIKDTIAKLPGDILSETKK